MASDFAAGSSCFCCFCCLLASGTGVAELPPLLSSADAFGDALDLNMPPNILRSFAALAASSLRMDSTSARSSVFEGSTSSAISRSLLASEKLPRSFCALALKKSALMFFCIELKCFRSAVDGLRKHTLAHLGDGEVLEQGAHELITVRLDFLICNLSGVNESKLVVCNGIFKSVKLKFLVALFLVLQCGLELVLVGHLIQFFLPANGVLRDIRNAAVVKFNDVRRGAVGTNIFDESNTIGSEDIGAYGSHLRSCARLHLRSFRGARSTIPQGRILFRGRFFRL
mmetsp:Transcript_17308/g.33994  ORF Transcript_17308/g.33994 Transcript_17308/m.33994 type:complete len:284 (+) Transcript_17308:295-1146(+)